MSTSLTRRLAALALSVTASVGAAGALATPAHAATLTASVGQRVGWGLVGFTYDANTGVIGSRNVNASVANATPGARIQLRVRDASNSTWFQNIVVADSLGRAQITVTGLPRSACGHTLMVQVVDYGSNTYKSMPSITDNCRPMVNLTQSGSIVGDGFTPGSTAGITTTTAGSQIVNVSSTGYWLTINGSRVFIKTVPGQVNTNIRPQQYTYYSGRDLTTGVSDTQYYF